MPEEKDQASLPDRLVDMYRKSGTVTSFILINGFVIAAIVFGVLHFTLGDVKMTEARSATRDLLRATEQAISEAEKNMRGLGYFYSSISPRVEADSQITLNVHKLLTDDAQMQGILWTTEKGVWRQQDLVHKSERSAYDDLLGWPTYQDLYRATFSHQYNTVNYLKEMPWPAFKNKGVEAAEGSPVGLTMKVKLPDGAIGILMAITTPEKIFGSGWSTQRADIARISIRDGETGAVMLDNQLNLARAKGMISTVEANYILNLGDKSWDIRFDVVPSMSSSVMASASWLALSLILTLTFAAAFSAERRYRQDVKLQEMSKTLEGAHHELQSRISERDKLFHALRKSERENRAVINSVSDIIFETDENGKLVFLNDTWKRITDREVADTLGQSLFQHLEAPERARQREMFEELVRGERQAYRAETRLDLGQGVLKPVEIAFSMVRMAEDKSIRIVGTITDIEKRRRAEMAVREAERRFRTIFENSISGIYQSSPEGHFISANPALAEILGYSSAEEMMASVTDIAHQLYVRPEERKAFVQKLLFEGKVSSVETEIFRKDGSRIWIMENARVVRSEKGGVQYYEGSIWDVTERKVAEDATRQARLQAEISSRSRMEFLANMSHELRTPLNAIIGFSEIIKDEVMGPHAIPVYKEYSKDIYDSGNYLLKVISDILEVSKIETGNRQLNVGNFRLTKSLKSCMTIISSRMDQAGVDVKIEVPDTLPEILAEELGFKQVMLNLIGNAIKFTPRGGHVRVTAQVLDSGEMIIDIIDTGIGMTAEEIVKAMQPFTKVDNNFNSMKAGTGLGLTIVDSLVRLHGGQFKLISEKGKGTTARVTMPAFRVLRAPEAATSQLKVVK